MPMSLHPLAGRPAPADLLIDVGKLERAYYERLPDLSDPNQLVSFGTGGHRGSPFDGSFTEAHILAMTQAICDYRRSQGIDGPLFMGKDSHAASPPAERTALEVFAANGVDVFIQRDNGVTPTPVISHAILVRNRGPHEHQADGIVVTPSHNPPEDGGFKYNPPHGGPADTHVTGWIQDQANGFVADGLTRVKRIPFERARRATTTHGFDYMGAYVTDLGSVVDLEVVRGAGLSLAVDPLGGAGVHYWPMIAERYRLPMTVVSDVVDPTFSFM